MHITPLSLAQSHAPVQLRTGPPLAFDPETGLLGLRPSFYSQVNSFDSSAPPAF